jgi:hypothetical protein
VSNESSRDEDITPTVGIDDDIVAWFTDDFANAAEGIQKRARELGHQIRSVGREASRRDREELFRMIALLCRMAHIVFADLDSEPIR